MRILILGGTRFLGRQVAKSLAALGHDLTLVSRRNTGAPSDVRFICDERTSGLAILQNSSFDIVLDFICYDEHGLGQVATSIFADRYVLISSTWLPRLWSGSRADELPNELISAVNGLPSVTINYLCGKLRAEKALTTLRQIGCKAVSLRLPIMLGEGDQTGRLNFYRYRLADGGPLIAVDGGYNQAQIAVMEDLAQAIVRWGTEVDIGRFPVWEALPDEGRSVRTIIETMATSAGLSVHLVEVPLAELGRGLPAYLEQEPFWRESALPKTEANIYSAVGMTPAVFGQKISMTPLVLVDHKMERLRKEELSFLAHRHSA